MTLPVAWNPISLGMIAAEFGGSGLLRLSNYYSGGGLVPGGTVGFPNGQATVIPSSGIITLGNFHGASKRVFIFMGDTGWVPGGEGFTKFTGFVVGGGGAGGNGSDGPRHGFGGGGGAGGVVPLVDHYIGTGGKWVEIGAGGGQGGDPWSSTAWDRIGHPTRAFGVEALGGGGGGGYMWSRGQTFGTNGGSGGGAGGSSAPSDSPGVGTPYQGNNGAHGHQNQQGGGGGGGGASASNQNGGAGIIISYPEAGFYREVAGGGGAGSWSGTRGLGTHGSGDGAWAYGGGGAAGWATGAGGGGAGEGALGGNGGSGFIVGWLS